MSYHPFILSKDSIHIVPAIIISIIIIIATWYCNRLLQKMIVKVCKTQQIEETVIKAVQNFIAIFIYSIGSILFLENLHIQITSFLSTLGALAIGAGFIFQNFLANLASGVFLLFYKPFCIGDYIFCTKPEAVFEGKIIDINLRNTILEREGNTVIVPNFTLYSSVITIKKEYNKKPF